MGWQDAPIVDQPSVPNAPAPQGQQPAWMAAPVVKADEPKDLRALATAKAQKYGLDPRLFTAQVGAESAFDNDAVSPKGAAGLGQLMPATAAELGVKDRHDPEQNLEASAKYMRQLLDRYGNNYDTALAAYNWGMGNVDKKGLANAPKETRDYVAKIRAKGGDSDVPIPGVVGDTFRPAPGPVASPNDLSVPENETLRDIKRIGLGLEKGIVQDLPQAAAQLVGTVIPDSLQRALGPNGGTINEYVEEKNAAYERNRKALGGEGFDAARLAGNIGNPANYIGGELAQMPAWFAKMSPKAQAVFRSMVTGGTAGAAQPVDTSTGQDVLTGKAQQAGAGAVLGPLAEAGVRLGTAGVGRLFGAATNDVTPQAAAAQQLGDQFGVRLTAGDIDRQRKLFTGVEGALENNRIPGMSIAPIRQQQQAQAQAAASRVADDELKRLNNMTFQNLDGVRAAAAVPGPRQAEAQKVLDMAQNAGSDERAIMQASGNLTWLRKKLSADKLYADVGRIAGDSEVAPTNTIKAIDDAIANAAKVVDVDPQSINLLQRWKAQLENPTAPTPGDEAAGAQLIPNTYGRMNAFRSDIFSRLQDSTTNGVTDSSKLFMKNIAGAVKNDMDAFADSTPALKEANQRANAFYNRQVVPYQKATLAKALTNDDPDKIYGAFIRAQAEGKGDYAAQHFWKALDEKGRQAVRYGIVRAGLKNATDGDSFSPAKFKSFVDNTEYGQYFRGPEKSRIDGLMTLFGHLDRATPEHLIKYQPIFGSTAQTVGAGALFAGGGVPALATGAGGAAFLKWLMTSQAGKRILFSSNVLAKGGSKEQVGNFLDKTATEFNKAVGTAAGAEAGERGRVLP